MRRAAGTVCATVLLAAASVAPAQQTIAAATATHGEIRADRHGLVLPAGEFTVPELIEATADFLCRNYLYDYGKAEQAGMFRLQRPVAVDALGAEELLYALLSTRGFAVLPIDELRGVYGVLYLGATDRDPSPPLQSPWRPAEEILRRPQLREIVYSHVLLEHADAREVARMLRDLDRHQTWRPGHLLASASSSRFLMLHGYRDRIANAIRIAQQIDRYAKPRQQRSLPDRSLLDRIADLERRIRALEQRPR